MSDRSKRSKSASKRTSALIQAAQDAHGPRAAGSVKPRRARPDAKRLEARASDKDRFSPGPSRPVASAKMDEDTALELSVDEERAGQRLDNFLVAQLKGVPKSLFYRLLRQGAIRVNGKRAKPALKLDAGARIHVPPLRRAVAGAPLLPESGKLEWLNTRVLFEDTVLLVLDKPVGLASHGGSGLSYGAIEAMRALRPALNLELVHRLDRDTSGLLLFAKKRSALKGLQQLIRDGQVAKDYQLLVHGQPPRTQFEVRAPLAKNVLSSGERMVRVDAEGKDALTRFTVLEPLADFCQLKARILTGRTHQIRVHALTAGIPIVGDRKYGDADRDHAAQALGFARMALHAWQLAFTLGEKSYRFEAPLPDDWQRLLLKLRSSEAS